MTSPQKVKIFGPDQRPSSVVQWTPIVRPQVQKKKDISEFPKNSNNTNILMP